MAPWGAPLCAFGTAQIQKPISVKPIMIVPDFWAESGRQHKAGSKQITVRRYGWSNESDADAQAKAEARAEDALQRILSGEKLIKREPKRPYNGADGVPIREEVLARHGEQVITRNAYGAHCLNSPNALFADVDFDQEAPSKLAYLAFWLFAFACAAASISPRNWPLFFGLSILALIISAPVVNLAARIVVAARGGHEHNARTRLLAFIAKNPSWNVRVYRTPAGLRLLATHQPFEAPSEQVTSFFTAVPTDPFYMKMCANQRCFRARLSAKPWRIGISAHMRPRPGIWPVRPERLAIRNAWISQYELAASQFAACRYIESLGSGVVDPAIQAVIDLHDRESGALLIGAKLA
ncbi:MAG: hypothetical protein RL748_2449 [Pseudomonadota bacterium]|jgi:hypothetical protein